MVCADTNFLVSLEKRDKAALAKLQELESRDDPVYSTVITVAEFFKGANGARDRAKALRDARDLLARFGILNLDFHAAQIWGELAQQLKSDMIGDRDLFIASIALANNQTVLTKNLKYFERVPGLIVESW